MGTVVHATGGSLRLDRIFEQYFVDVHRRRGNAELVARLRRHGIVTFDGVQGPSDLLRLARSIGNVLPHRDSDVRGVTTLAGTDSGNLRRQGYLGFSSEALFPHTDGSSIPSPPCLVLLACEVPAAQGGATLVVDGCALYERLRTNMPATLAALSRYGSARFGGESGYHGSVFEVVAGDQPDTARWVSIRFRWDGLAIFSPSTSAALPAFLELVEESTLKFTLDRGQGYIIQNGRWLHGRTEYAGHRRVHRVLISPHRRYRSDMDTIPFGFAPACST